MPKDGTAMLGHLRLASGILSTSEFYRRNNIECVFWKLSNHNSYTRATKYFNSARANPSSDASNPMGDIGF